MDATTPCLTYGKHEIFGEIALGGDPGTCAAEDALAMALAINCPQQHFPPFARLEVLLDGLLIGHMYSIRYAWGGRCYEFCSLSGRTRFSCSTKEALASSLEDVLALARQNQ